MAAYTVIANQHANVREFPSSMSNVASSVETNQSYPADGWVNGDTVLDNGITNDVWVRLTLNTGNVGYVSAVYLLGDEHGNLPPEAHLWSNL